MAYADFREYLAALEERGKLCRISREVDKDWEISAVAKRVFQRIPQARRPALLFERVKGFGMPVAAGVLGASREVYGLALGTTADRIQEVWAAGTRNPIPPVTVASGPCQERQASLAALPVPVWTVGHDPGPYLTAPCVVSVDPQTGLRNMGTYRLQVRADGNLGMYVGIAQHLMRHIRLNDAKGQKTPVAIVLGTDPVIGLCSVAKMASSEEELAVAGGIRGAAVELVRCVSQPLEVPATAEVVIEGELLPNERVDEGPFGEFTGYMGAAGNHQLVHITAVTTRRDPILQTFVSQMPPSESSCIRGLGRELPLLTQLRDTLGLPVVDVHLPESGSSAAWVVVSVRQAYPGVASQVFAAVQAFAPQYGKYTVVVDDDIDVRDPFQVNWALAWRTLPDQDFYVYRDTPASALDPSVAPMDVLQSDPRRKRSAKMGIDATRKHAFPPVSLPPPEHMAQVDRMWGEYGLPEA